MKNLVNAMTKLEKVLVNKTGIAASSNDISFIFDDFKYNDFTALVDQKIFKKSMDIIDFKLDKISIDDDTIDLFNGSSKVTIANKNESCYKPFMQEGSGSKIEIDTDKLIECLSCTPQKMGNISIEGVRVDKNGYTSTDTYRLYHIKDNFNMDLTIPLKVVEFLKTCKAPRIIKLEKLECNTYKIKLDYGTLFFKATELNFPDAQHIIRTSSSYCDKEYTINKKTFINVLKKGVKVENNDCKYGAIFNFKRKEFDILVTSSIMEFKATEKVLDGSNENLKISLDQKFLQSAIAKIKSNSFTISGSRSSAMVKIQGEDLTRTEIIMPLALRD